MKCDICGKEKAVLHIQEIIGNERHQINICKECEINGNIMEIIAVEIAKTKVFCIIKPKFEEDKSSK